jgi:AcrR family transcriptional regulator
MGKEFRMARLPNPGIRASLLDQAVDYVLSHGVRDLTLRPLAKDLKTSARMLVYHFGSREGLMREILSRAREREDARVETWFQSGKSPRTMRQFLRWFWKRWTVPQLRPAIRLVFELYALALRNPRAYPGVLEDPLAYWQKLTEKAGIATKPDAVEATLLLAATRGLLLDLCATGDRTRVELAMEALAEFFEWRVTPTKMMGRQLEKSNGG